MHGCYFDFPHLRKPKEYFTALLPASTTLQEYNVLKLCSLLNLQYLTLNSRVELLQSVRNISPRLINHLAPDKPTKLIAAYLFIPQSKCKSCPRSELCFSCPVLGTSQVIEHTQTRK